MPIDYRRLVRGLTALSTIVAESPGLPALQALIQVAQEAAGAQAATFIEYGPSVCRITLATGRMVATTGQPISSAHITLRSQPDDTELRRIEDIPPDLAAGPLRQGLATLLGASIRANGEPVGSVQLYFDADAVDDVEGVVDIMQLVVGAARHIFDPPATAGLATIADAEDRALFLAVAGHELRTPVTVIKGYSSMLADRWDALDEATRREASRVLTIRADELARLVDRLMRASTGESEQGWLVRTVPFDPVEALARTARDLPMDLRRSFRLVVPEGLPKAIGDPALLTSVVAELVTNAVRATPPAQIGRDGQPSVDLRAGADAETVFIQVRDRGVGIDPSQAEIAFERFWRGGYNGGDARSGVGLGLYLVRRLVERQMGWVSLRPRDGGGTVAEVRLLRADGQDRPPKLGEA
jgi:signal transduction histidine kinase